MSTGLHVELAWGSGRPVTEGVQEDRPHEQPFAYLNLPNPTFL